MFKSTICRWRQWHCPIYAKTFYWRILGTGTGVLARQFARQGAIVTGTDISTEQIAAAKKLAAQENPGIDFRVAPAEQSPFPDNSFNVITANQCWLYFDKSKVLPEIKRLLTFPGLLVISYFSWLPRLDAIARAIAFTRETWRGRIRASRGIGAALSADFSACVRGKSYKGIIFGKPISLY